MNSLYLKIKMNIEQIIFILPQFKICAYNRFVSLVYLAGHYIIYVGAGVQISVIPLIHLNVYKPKYFCFEKTR
jgi:hypothetical protein